MCVGSNLRFVFGNRRQDDELWACTSSSRDDWQDVLYSQSTAECSSGMKDAECRYLVIL